MFTLIHIWDLALGRFNFNFSCQKYLMAVMTPMLLKLYVDLGVVEIVALLSRNYRKFRVINSPPNK